MKKQLLFLLIGLVLSLVTTGQQATKALQDTGNAKLNAIRLQSISNKTVIVGSSALPSGAATSANQSTHNTRLLNIENNTSAIYDGVLVVSAQLDSISKRRVMPKIFSCSFTVAPASSCTDLVFFEGSNTNQAHIRKVILTGTQTTTGKIWVDLVIKSSANSGGTSTSKAGVPYINSGLVGIPTATLLAYTANPTLGSGTTIRKVLLPVTSTTDAGYSEATIDFTMDGYDVWLTSGIYFAINLGGQTVSGGVIGITIIWSEE